MFLAILIFWLKLIDKCGESEIGRELEGSILVGPAGAYIGNDIRPIL